ncbi:MAG: hypothetical protein HYZ11_11450 [Candidatus Tectomicrobia bacterium]|uniref:Uncharacterized protein n=1 Tax=Tectimicrobiota bacterium TaxID=2528274 RepID=A0A932I2M6_UNCTE|nr:hypothetical protein [Candidatus Tectomicrobia bacterium]
MPSLMRAAGGAALAAALLSGAAEAAVYRSEVRPAPGSQTQGVLSLQVAGTVLTVSGKLERVPPGPVYGLLISRKCGEFEDGSSFLLASLLESGGDRALSVHESLSLDFRLSSAVEKLEDMMISLFRQSHVVTMKAAYPRPVTHIACGAIELWSP